MGMKKFTAQSVQVGEGGIKMIRGVVILAVVLFLLFVVGLSSTATVETGHLGVVTTFGAATDRVLQPGLNFKRPFMDGVEEFDIRTQKEEADAEAASKDLQSVNAKLAVNYRLDPLKVQEVFKTIGKQYKDIIVNPQVQEAFKQVTAQYTAEELITKREEVKGKARTVLSDRLKRFNVIVDDLTIVNFDFASQEFKNAIEQKQVAAQNVLRTQQELQQAKVEAEKRVVEAKARADSLLLEADAAAKAQQLQQQSLSELYIQNKAVEKWDGKLPQVNGGTGAVPFINVPVATPTPAR
jgi:regulator of protease activity HflC (stomatin/prohibitin superfamily)